MEVLKNKIEHPFLLLKKYLEMDPEEQKIYDQYALLIWNICETVYDRNKVDKTWYPVLKKERINHLDWIEKPENREGFKDEFLKFIGNNDYFKEKLPPKMRSRTALKVWKENRLIIVILPLLLIVTLIVIPASPYNLQYFDSRIAIDCARNHSAYGVNASSTCSQFSSGSLAELCAIDPKEFGQNHTIDCAKHLKLVNDSKPHK
jgi:hypothetical protein